VLGLAALLSAAAAIAADAAAVEDPGSSAVTDEAEWGRLPLARARGRALQVLIFSIAQR